MRHGYPNLRQWGWREGVHDVRHLTWEHPWVVVYDGATVGCWSREEARFTWKHYPMPGLGWAG